MEFYSLNGNAPTVCAREAILQGLAPDGGLYMPTQIPQLPEEFLRNLSGYALSEIGLAMTSPYLEAEVPATMLASICRESFSC